MTTTPGDAAQLAVAVLDAEAEREAQQAAAQEEVLFATDLLPGVGEERGLARPGGAHRRRQHVRRAPAPALVGGARVGDPLGARTRPAPRVRGERRDHRVPRRGVGRVPRARRAADGLAGRPLPPAADHRLGQPRVRRLPRALRCGHQRVPAVLGAARRRRRQVEHLPGAGLADRRRLSDRRARPHQRVAGDGRRASSACSARSSSAASPPGVGGDDGWRWPFVLLGFPVAIVAVFAFKLPEPPRGQFEKQDVLGEVIEDEQPAPISVEAAFARLWQIRTLKTVIVAFSAHGLRAVHRPRAHQPLHGGPLRHRHLRPRVCSAPSAASACCSCCRSSGSTTTTSTVAIPRERCGSWG